MDQKITIHYDFTDGTELSYGEGKNTFDKDFTTHCLEFFNTWNLNAVVVKKNGSSIRVIDLLENKNGHSCKEIRKCHDIRKMLVAGAFEWKQLEKGE